MRKIYQTEFYDPVEGTRGNCLRAVMATLFKEELKGIPELYPDETQTRKMIAFVKSRGYDYAGCWVVPHGLKRKEEKEEALLRELKANPNNKIEGYYLVWGTSNRGIGHVVLYDEHKMVHDPHPSGDGVTIEGVYWFEKQDYGFDPFIHN